MFETHLEPCRFVAGLKLIIIFRESDPVDLDQNRVDDTL